MLYANEGEHAFNMINSLLSCIVGLKDNFATKRGRLISLSPWVVVICSKLSVFYIDNEL